VHIYDNGWCLIGIFDSWDLVIRAEYVEDNFIPIVYIGRNAKVETGGCSYIPALPCTCLLGNYNNICLHGLPWRSNEIMWWAQCYPWSKAGLNEAEVILLG
jgi:hypothetical protein